MQSLRFMNQRTVAAGVILAAAFLYLAIFAVNRVFADYTPPSSPYFAVGSAGANVQDQGTVLDESDAAGAWNIWTSTSKLNLSTSGCGTTIACIIYANEGATLTLTDCDIDVISGTSTWALTYQIAGAYTNTTDTDCDKYADTSHPIFVVDLNSSMSFSATAKLHIARHEMGHGINLWDASGVSCWQNAYGYWLPLMVNGSTNCSTYPSNYSASDNEISAVKSRNSW